MEYKVQFQAFVNLSDLTKDLSKKSKDCINEMAKSYLDLWDNNPFILYRFHDFIKTINEQLFDNMVKTEKPNKKTIKEIKQWISDVEDESNLIGIDIILDINPKCTKTTSDSTDYYLPNPYLQFGGNI